MSVHTYRSRPMSPPVPKLRELIHQSNTPWGWAGAWPLSPGATVPPNRASVVYGLYGPGATLAYIGVTDYFRLRMMNHQRDGKRWVAWEAKSFPDRAAADRAEDELITKFRPPLNRWVDGTIVRRTVR